METENILKDTELEKVAGGRARLDENVRNAFHSAEVQLESIINNRADVNFSNNVNSMLRVCRQALDGIVTVEAALHCMQDYCNQINIDYRWNPQNILNQLRSSLGR